MARGFNEAYIKGRDDLFALVPPNVGTVLDLGCSVGALGARIRKSYNAQVTGIELNRNMASIAMKKLDRVIVGDLDTLDLHKILPMKYFDCIIAGDVLEHLKDPWRVMKALQKCLKDTGVMIISIPNVRHYTTLYNVAILGKWPYRERGIHDRTHLRFFTLKNVRELCQSSTLRIECVRRNYRIVEKPHKLNGIAKYLAYFPFREFFVFQYIVTLRK